MLYRKLKILYFTHSFWFLVIVCCLALFVLSFVSLFAMDSFFAQQQIYTLPLETLKMIAWSILSALFFVKIMYSGRFTMSARNPRIKENEIKVRMNDVIGLKEAKREALEVVSLIKDHAKLRKMGGRAVRGMLMTGPPGCGKTYLAKAIAREANVPFYSMSGSEFVEMFVGVGASRVRRIFEIARNQAYISGAAIIFIDELDALGRQRSFSFFGGQEGDSTLNQLLVCMDGLADEKGGNVIVLGATNAAESTLDAALLRPGRFDRKIVITRPKLSDREELFRYYLKNIKFDATIDIPRLARKTVRRTPADIQNIVQESALVAMRDNRDTITYKDVSEAIERVDLGQQTYLDLTPEEKERVACHESGHLVVLYTQHPTDDVFKASIKTRGGALGVVYHHPREELYMRTRDEIYADIKVALAGFVAEKVKYGNTSTGACSDFSNAMGVASDMVWQYGMSLNGFIGDYTVLLENNRTKSESRISDALKDHLNEETEKIMQQAAKEVEVFLKKNAELMRVFTQELLEKGELDYDEIEAIFKSHGKERNPS
jgi:cell division protease FtsH